MRGTTASLCPWIGWFRHGGLEELLGHANGAKGQWRTARDAQRWPEEELGLKIAGKEVYRHLGKLGGRLQVGRRSHVKKDPAAAEAFKGGGLEAKLAAHAGAGVGVR